MEGAATELGGGVGGGSAARGAAMSGEADAAVAGPAAGLADEGPGWLWVPATRGAHSAA